jgi:hypothetical protein
VKKDSKRFHPTRMARVIVPIVLGLIFIGMLAAILLVILSVVGVFPGN